MFWTDLRKKFWLLIFDYNLYMRNQRPTFAILKFLLPIIYLTKKKPDLSHIDHLRHTKVYKISDTISAKSEKFEAIEVKDHFHGYKSTSF